MMYPEIDVTRPVVTRGGYPARIICTDAEGDADRPIVALIREHIKAVGYNEWTHRFYRTGRHAPGGMDSPYDLFNVPLDDRATALERRIEDAMRILRGDPPSTWLRR